MTVLENFLKNKRVQKTLNTKPGEEGFSLVELVVVIAVLAILSAVAIPAFVGVQANARASAVKNALVNGVKECVVRKADFKSTDFADAQSFQGNYQGYNITVVTTEIPNPNTEDSEPSSANVMIESVESIGVMNSFTASLNTGLSLSMSAIAGENE